jgi:serine/threonine-protein kinase NIM1
MNDIIHRDLKAENIFLVDRSIKLGDFGFSTVSDASRRLNKFCGSIPYAAPELFTEDSYLGRPVDMWASGVTLYFMLSGKMPFTGESIAELQSNIVNGDFPSLENVTPPCWDLICRLLCVGVCSRLTSWETSGNEWVGQSSSPPLNSQSQLINHSNTSYGNQEMVDKESLDAEILQRLEAMGLPLEGVDFSAEPRNPTLGTYRILLHEKCSEVCMDACLPNQSQQQITAKGSFISAGKGKGSRLQGRSKFCTIS